MMEDYKFLSMHKPVLLHEVIAILDPREGDFVIDGTLGGGGHAREIIKHIGKRGMFLGVDKDHEAIARFKDYSALPKSSFFMEQSNYAYIPGILKKNNMPKADGLIIDLGFSSYQIDDPKRGFSFHSDGPLDMRYGNSGMTTEEIINTFSEEKLIDIISRYGEERFSRRIARAIMESRKDRRITRTFELADIIKHAYPSRFRHGRIHPATKTFQAIRIAVNQELENLEKLLSSLPDIVNSGGRVAVISFHSLEDRMVKRSFKELTSSGKAEILTKKPIVPRREEVEGNPKSRSAKLRGIRFI